MSEIKKPTEHPRRRASDRLLVNFTPNEHNLVLLKLMLEEYGAELETDDAGRVIALLLRIPVAV